MREAQLQCERVLATSRFKFQAARHARSLSFERKASFSPSLSRSLKGASALARLRSFICPRADRSSIPA